MHNATTLNSQLQNSPAILNYARVSFSLCGEDLQAWLLLHEEKEKGLIVDLGAYHPMLWSNSFLFYLNGWRGVNVDANPESVELFQALRPQDTNLRAFVSDAVEEVRYCYFNEGAYNGKSAADPEVHNLNASQDRKIWKVEMLQTLPVNSILEQHVGNQKFDLLSIDCEGMDKRIFLGIDFTRFRPKIICIELGLEDLLSESMRCFLEKIGYEILSICFHSSLLRRKD